MNILHFVLFFLFSLNRFAKIQKIKVQGLHGLFATLRAPAHKLFISVTLFAILTHSSTFQSLFRCAPLRLQRATPTLKGKKSLHSNHHHRSACARK
jgi:hypothetical protein